MLSPDFSVPLFIPFDQSQWGCLNVIGQELVRQVAVQCHDRGIVLHRVSCTHEQQSALSFMPSCYLFACVWGHIYSMYAKPSVENIA